MIRLGQSQHSAWWRYVCTRLAGAVLIVVSLPANALNITQIELREFPIDSKGWSQQINQAYFDHNRRLQWNSEVIDRATTLSCDPTGNTETARASGAQWLTRLLVPRVDELRCSTRVNGQASQSKTTLFGIDTQGKVAWQRQLLFPSASHSVRRWLIGASPTALVLSDLEVWSPVDGRILHPAPVRYVQEKNARRPVPLYSFAYTASFAPKQKAFYVFTPNKDAGLAPGIRRISAESGAQSLLWPLQHNWFGRMNIEHMLVDATGRWLLLAQRWERRGPSWVEFAVIDTQRGKRVFRKRFGDNCVCQQPHIVAGPEGQFAFVYQDRTAGKHMAIHYAGISTVEDSAADSVK